MPLLTKEERQSLSGTERRALRKQRRQERSAEGKNLFPGVSVDVGNLTAIAMDEMREVAEDALPGKDKMHEVLDVLAERADEFLIWHWAGPAGIALEAIDGPLVKALIKLAIRPLVDQIYRNLAQRGLV